MYTEIARNKRRTVFLIFAFLLLIMALGWVFARAYDNPAILYFAVIFSMVQALVSYYYSDSITLAMSGAHGPITKKDHPELYRVVENLSITAGLPMPRVYIIDDTAPNAFATGRNPQKAAVAVTTGILQKLDKTELEGVIAHELCHIGNYDIRLMTLVVVLVGIVTLLADWFLRMTWISGRDREREGNTYIFLIGVAFAILAPLFAALIQLAVSRKREFLADASGALLTRYPEGLASALLKIDRDREPLEVANRATAHLYIANPFKEGHGSVVSWMSGLFSTHPPIAERVRRLREMGTRL